MLIYMTISEQIRVLCIRCNVSNAELARRLGISPQNLSAKLRRGSFSIVDIEQIADALNVEFERNFVLPNGEKV